MFRIFAKLMLSFLIICASMVMAGCSINKGIDKSPDAEDTSFIENESSISEAGENIDDIQSEDIDTLDSNYEYYLTAEELTESIEQGYVFYMDKTFEDPAMPTVTGGNWFFYVNEDNTLNLEISYSNLFTEPVEDSGIIGFPIDKEIIVEVLSPDDEVVYSFVKQGEEILEATSVQEEIKVTPGEWNLKMTFSYVSHGREAPSNLKIAAAYEEPSKEDIQWLKDNRMND